MAAKFLSQLSPRPNRFRSYCFVKTDMTGTMNGTVALGARTALDVSIQEPYEADHARWKDAVIIIFRRFRPLYFRVQNYVTPA